MSLKFMFQKDRKLLFRSSPKKQGKSLNSFVVELINRAMADV